MTFKEALEIREQDTELEHQLRAAKIVSWLLDQEEIKEDEAEELFLRLWDDISNSDDEFDDIVFNIIEDIREERSERD